MMCPRCKRELRQWPLERGDKCAPKDWVYCIRPVHIDFTTPGFEYPAPSEAL